MRLARLWRVGWAVRMSRFLSSFPATASHMSFGRSVIQVLLVGSLVALVKTGHLLDLEAQHLHGVGVGDRRRPPASRELVLDGLLRLPVMFGELFHRHQVWYRRTHWGILSSGVSFRPSSRWGFSFLRNLAVVDGHGVEPWSRSLPRTHDLRDLDWGQPAPPEAGRRRIDQSRRPTGPRKPTPYLSVVFQLSRGLFGFPSAMPDGFPRRPARLLFDARLAQNEAQEPQGNEPEAHERGQTVADGMRATRVRHHPADAHREHEGPEYEATCETTRRFGVLRLPVAAEMTAILFDRHHAASLSASAAAKVLTGSPPDNCCAATNAARLMSSPSSHLAMVMRLRLLASAMLVILVLDSSTRLRVSWVARFATSIAGRLDMC
nr:MAG TPA: hypothetical protein [Caudoviricetes sp.]